LSDLKSREFIAAFFYPESGSWMGWSVRFSACRTRCCDAQWPFHSRELQRRHVPQKSYNPPC